MNFSQITLLLAYSIGMSLGQVLFKRASTELQGNQAASGVWHIFTSLVINPYFVAAMGLYILLTGVWVWILSFTPLSRAYPFMGLGYVFIPLLSFMFFGEQLSGRFFLGVGAIVFGLILVATSNA